MGMPKKRGSPYHCERGSLCHEGARERRKERARDIFSIIFVLFL